MRGFEIVRKQLVQSAALASLIGAGIVGHLLCQASLAKSPDWRELAPPVIEGKWLRPAADGAAQPIWGHINGLQIGLAPMPGPRGLLRVYAPVLGLGEGRVINFIAVEPIPRADERRGLSELERSKLDNRHGKRFWSSLDPTDATPRDPVRPTCGRIVNAGNVEMLQVWILVEPFENGAHVYLRLSFREDRPNEVAIATFAHDDSEPLEHCIVTATMGNFARLRELHLADRTVTAGELWPDYRDIAFAPHARFPLRELRRTPAGDAIVTATPDETDPGAAHYAPGTSRHWRYDGKLATQSWRAEQPSDELEVLVNGRVAYWGSLAPIPGGISFENFEMVAPFEQGQEFWFGVEPMAMNDADDRR